MEAACFLHEDKPAKFALTVPCAAGGRIWICQECQDGRPASLGPLFEKYQAGHKPQIARQRALHKAMTN
jgi:hypothetical protein